MSFPDLFLQEVWNRATIERRKYVTIVPLPDWKPDSLLKLWQASPCVAFSGQLNSKHQMICVAADCCMESQVDGWTAPPSLQNSKQTDLYKAKVKLAMDLATGGSCNFAFCFDGRSRDARKVIEESQPSGDMAELWITYVGKLHRSHTRKVFASQNNREICFIKMPVPRVRVSAVDRQDSHVTQLLIILLRCHARSTTHTFTVVGIVLHCFL